MSLMERVLRFWRLPAEPLPEDLVATSEAKIVIELLLDLEDSCRKLDTLDNKQARGDIARILIQIDAARTRGNGEPENTGETP